MNTYSVRIAFTDGIYENTVHAYTQEQAYALALQDARMLSPYGTFFGAVINHTVTLKEA